jgi:hypothetical protein
MTLETKGRLNYFFRHFSSFFSLKVEVDLRTLAFLAQIFRAEVYFLHIFGGKGFSVEFLGKTIFQNFFR